MQTGVLLGQERIKAAAGPAPIRADHNLSIAVVTVQAIRGHAGEVLRTGFPVSCRLLGEKLTIPAPKKAPKPDFGGDRTAEQAAEKEQLNAVVLTALRILGGKVAQKFSISRAAVDSKKRYPHTCSNHRSGEVIWFIVDGADGKRESGIFSVCADCGGVNDFDTDLDVGLYKLPVVQPPQEPVKASQEAEKPPKKSRARGSRSTHHASLSAG